MEDVEEKIIPKETKTRSGRAVRRRIIGGTQEDEKNKSQNAKDLNSSNVSADSDISSASRASSKNSDRSRSRSPIKKATPKATEPVRKSKKDKSNVPSKDNSQEEYIN